MSQSTATESVKKSLSSSPFQVDRDQRDQLGRGRCLSPTPSGEDLTDVELEEIFAQTFDLIHFCTTQVDEQKIRNLSMAFIMLKIKESIDHICADYLPKLYAFLNQAEKITADEYARTCRVLPTYGDYVKAIEAEVDGMIHAGGDNAISKRELLDLMRDVTDTSCDTATIIRWEGFLMEDVAIYMKQRRCVVCSIEAVPNWVNIQESTTCQLDRIREDLFQALAHLTFLREELKLWTSSKSRKPIGQERKPTKDSAGDPKDGTKDVQPKESPLKSDVIGKTLKRTDSVLPQPISQKRKSSKDPADDPKEAAKDDRPKESPRNSDDISLPKGRIRTYKPNEQTEDTLT